MSTRKFSESFHDIAEYCVQCDPNDRPSITQLLSHVFFKQCKKSDTNLLDILKPIKPIDEDFVENLGNYYYKKKSIILL